jgi:glycosyltransferase involved in cell wall biosynthesis
MSNPKVSVLIPTYNQESVIEETLLSTLMQDYDNLEVVVTDDASHDRTPQILRDMEAKFRGRLKVFLHQENIGVTRNHTRGLLQCTGDFVAFQDGDDLFLPGKIQKQVAFMLSHPQCTICSHDVDVFDSNTGKTLYFWSRRFGHRAGGIRKLLRYGNYLCSVSVMVRRQDVPSYGYDDRIRVGSDWMLWLDVLSHGKGEMCYLNEVLARYRRHAGNLTNVSGWKYEDQLVTLALAETKWPHLLFPIRMRRSEIECMMALGAFSARKTGQAWKYFVESCITGFPFFPWARLVWRELLFRVGRRNAKDDILASFTSPNQTHEHS